MLANRRSVHVVLAACALLAMASPARAANPCPHLARLEMEVETQEARRALLQDAATLAPTFQPSAAYIAAAKKMFDKFRSQIKDCEISAKDMEYNGGANRIDGPGVWFPAAAWLRFFFHDAGSFDAETGTGGLNGSIGANCETEDCFDDPEKTTTVTEVAEGTTCSNGFPAVGNFYPYDGKNFCCSDANKCIGRYHTDEGVPIPVCLRGNPETTEMCRGENSGLLPTLDFYRESQRDFPVRGGCGKSSIYNRDCFVTLADVNVLGTAAVVKQCSNGLVDVPITLGRVDAQVADAFLPPLPSPADVIEDPHLEIFGRMGLDAVDQVTLLTGSHSIGGFRRANSPGLTTCPFVPFDCTPSGQFNATSFDNNVFKVACEGVQGVTVGECDWFKQCTDTTTDEKTCPFGKENTAAFDVCNGPEATFPKPGLISDRDMCQNKPLFQPTMVEFANDRSKFYAEYKARFLKMGNLGYEPTQLTPVKFLPGSGGGGVIVPTTPASPPPPAIKPPSCTINAVPNVRYKQTTAGSFIGAATAKNIAACQSLCLQKAACLTYSYSTKEKYCAFFSLPATQLAQGGGGKAWISGSKTCA